MCDASDILDYRVGKKREILSPRERERKEIKKNSTELLLGIDVNKIMLNIGTLVAEQNVQSSIE